MRAHCKTCEIELTPGLRAGGKSDHLCKPCLKEYKRGYYIKNKERLQVQFKIRHEERMANDPEYKAKRRSFMKEYNKTYDYKSHYANNKDKYKVNRDKYRAKPETKILRLAEVRKRQADKLQATPPWASKGYMRLFYEGAKMESERTGREVEVDHIIPLRHKLVCGLHCEQNMQWLFSEDNKSKSNTF